MTRVTTRARHGIYCYYVQPNAAFDGMHLVLSTLTNAAHYISLYVYTTGSGQPQVTLTGRAWHAMTAIGGRTGGWVRYGVAVDATHASGSTRLDIRLDAAAEFWVDSAQVEPTTYATTYIDGDQPGCRWVGVRHGSYSTRSAQETTGGRARDLYDDYSISVVEGSKRIGMPPLTHHLLGHSQMPGAMYQGSKVLPREIELHLHHVEDSWALFHGKRQTIIDLLKPDRVSEQRPVVIGYSGGGDTLYSSFYYSGGLEFGDFMAYDEVAAVRLLAPDPFWYADDQEAANLNFTQLLTVNYGMRRDNGEWGVFGAGFANPTNPGTVFVVKHDPNTGRTYYGGLFTTANGVVVNSICYWDGSAFRPLGSGTSGQVQAIAIAANGDVWIGGQFTAVGGVAGQQHIARWNVATSTWTTFGTAANSSVLALAIGDDGTLYAGGTFTNFNANANADYIVSYDGSTWAALSTGANSTVFALDIGLDGTLYAGGSFTTIGGTSAPYVAAWNGSTWAALSTGANDTVRALHCARDGSIYIGGDFTTLAGVSAARIARWNGTAAEALGSGVNDTVQTIHQVESGELYVGGSVTTAGGLAVDSYSAGWNGYTWFALEINIPGAVQSFASRGNDLFLGSDSSGLGYFAQVTQVTPSATAAVTPVITLTGPTTAGATCLLRWLENQSTGQKMYFYLTVQAGETVTIDPLAGAVVSSWRGLLTDQPLANSDFTNWRLLPARADGGAANVIAAFVSGTTTGVSLLAHFQPKHWSADGAA